MAVPELLVLTSLLFVFAVIALLLLLSHSRWRFPSALALLLAGFLLAHWQAYMPPMLFDSLIGRVLAILAQPRLDLLLPIFLPLWIFSFAQAMQWPVLSHYRPLGVLFLIQFFLSIALLLAASYYWQALGWSSRAMLGFVMLASVSSFSQGFVLRLLAAKQQFYLQACAWLSCLAFATSLGLIDIYYFQRDSLSLSIAALLLLLLAGYVLGRLAAWLQCHFVRFEQSLLIAVLPPVLWYLFVDALYQSLALLALSSYVLAWQSHTRQLIAVGDYFKQRSQRMLSFSLRFASAVLLFWCGFQLSYLDWSQTFLYHLVLISFCIFAVRLLVALLSFAAVKLLFPSAARLALLGGVLQSSALHILLLFLCAPWFTLNELRQMLAPLALLIVFNQLVGPWCIQALLPKQGGRSYMLRQASREVDRQLANNMSELQRDYFLSAADWGQLRLECLSGLSRHVHLAAAKTTQTQQHTQTPLKQLVACYYQQYYAGELSRRALHRLLAMSYQSNSDSGKFLSVKQVSQLFRVPSIVIMVERYPQWRRAVFACYHTMMVTRFEMARAYYNALQQLIEQYAQANDEEAITLSGLLANLHQQQRLLLRSFNLWRQHFPDLASSVETTAAQRVLLFNKQRIAGSLLQQGKLNEAALGQLVWQYQRELRALRFRPPLLQQETLVEYLQGLEILQALSKLALWDLTKSAERSVYTRGEQVLHQGANNPGLIIVLRGELQLLRRSSHTICDMWVLHAGEHYYSSGGKHMCDASARALSEVELLLVSLALLEGLAKRYPIMQRLQQRVDCEVKMQL